MNKNYIVNALMLVGILYTLPTSAMNKMRLFKHTKKIDSRLVFNKQFYTKNYVKYLQHVPMRNYSSEIDNKKKDEEIKKINEFLKVEFRLPSKVLIALKGSAITFSMSLGGFCFGYGVFRAYEVLAPLGVFYLGYGIGGGVLCGFAYCREEYEIYKKQPVYQIVQSQQILKNVLHKYEALKEMQTSIKNNAIDFNAIHDPGDFMEKVLQSKKLAIKIDTLLNETKKLYPYPSLIQVDALHDDVKQRIIDVDVIKKQALDNQQLKDTWFVQLAEKNTDNPWNESKSEK